METRETRPDVIQGKFDGMRDTARGMSQTAHAALTEQVADMCKTSAGDSWQIKTRNGPKRIENDGKRPVLRWMDRKLKTKTLFCKSKEEE